MPICCLRIFSFEKKKNVSRDDDGKYNYNKDEIFFVSKVHPLLNYKDNSKEIKKDFLLLIICPNCNGRTKIPEKCLELINLEFTIYKNNLSPFNCDKCKIIIYQLNCNECSYIHHTIKKEENEKIKCFNCTKNNRNEDNNKNNYKDNSNDNKIEYFKENDNNDSEYFNTTEIILNSQSSIRINIENVTSSPNSNNRFLTLSGIDLSPFPEDLPLISGN